MSLTVTITGATFMCDTPGCQSTLTIPGVRNFGAMELLAPEYHWRDDPQSCGGVRRCPQCASAGWPWCAPAGGVMPDPALYADLDALFAWCDRNVFSLRPPVPEWHGHGECPAGVPCLIHQEPLEPAQEAAMTRLEKVWEDHEVTAELPVILSGEG